MCGEAGPFRSQSAGCRRKIRGVMGGMGGAWRQAPVKSRSAGRGPSDPPPLSVAMAAPPTGLALPDSREVASPVGRAATAADGGGWTGGGECCEEVRVE